MRAQVSGRRWRPLTSTVLARHNGPLTPAQQRAAVVLNGGRAAVLAAWTALELLGLRGWERPEIHVLLPRGARPPSFGELPVVVHQSRRMPDRARVRYGLPVADAARSAVDAAAWSATDRLACAVLAAAVRQRLVRPSALRRELEDCARRPRRRLLLGVVADIAGGAHALSELDFRRFCRRHGLPRPTGQQMRRDRRGVRRYLDAGFVTASGRRLRVEVDGSVHLSAATYADDMFRGNALVLVDELVLRFPSWAIRADDPQAVEQLRAALAG